jgi:D-sedoheptulose 7-phosphate isomerase
MGGLSQYGWRRMKLRISGSVILTSDLWEKENGKSWISYVAQVAAVASQIKESELEALWRFVENAYVNKQPIYIAGNGGCFSIAQHLTTDWTKGAISQAHGVFYDTKRRLRVKQLGANGSILTAWSNDHNYDIIYQEELRTFEHDNKDYSLLVLSCSGNSPNIVNVSNFAVDAGANVFGLVAFDGGKLRDLVPCVYVPTNAYTVSEDIFHQLFHYLVEKIRELIFSI